jgi:hypothetical protein
MQTPFSLEIKDLLVLFTTQIFGLIFKHLHKTTLLQEFKVILHKIEQSQSISKSSLICKESSFSRIYHSQRKNINE